MQITITLSDTDARMMRYSLRRRYHSKAELPKLIKLAAWRESADEAKKELAEMGLNAQEPESFDPLVEAGLVPADTQAEVDELSKKLAHNHAQLMEAASRKAE